MKRSAKTWIKGPYKNKNRDRSGLVVLLVLLVLLVLAVAVIALIRSAL